MPSYEGVPAVEAERLYPNPFTATLTLEWPDGRVRRVALGGPVVTVDLKREALIDWPSSRKAGHLIHYPGPVVEVTVMGQPIGDDA